MYEHMASKGEIKIYERGEGVWLVSSLGLVINNGTK